MSVLDCTMHKSINALTLGAHCAHQSPKGVVRVFVVQERLKDNHQLIHMMAINLVYQTTQNPVKMNEVNMHTYNCIQCITYANTTVCTKEYKNMGCPYLSLVTLL